MKKTIFKVITILTLAIFISSCETDDGTLDGIEGESKDVSVEASTTDKSTKKAGNTCHNWNIITYEGPVWIDVRNQKEYPYVNTIMTAEATCDGLWVASGGFKIIDNTKNKRKVRVKRINKNKGYLTFFTSDGRYSTRSFDAFIYPDTPVPCPGNEHVNMLSYAYTVMARKHNPKYTYSWKAVSPSQRIFYGTGSRIRLGYGRYTVTLSVSKPGCTTKTATETFFLESDGIPE
ncbi:hypothetical protein [Aquimarina macrocephali]|uniref:hypothetical protein n=1 Tax=Aquimarina macrocephali TaxID=666563 RepID=UPI0004654FD2|nr:hypothetical protein [Aquimarina macrocephali]